MTSQPELFSSFQPHNKTKNSLIAKTNLFSFLCTPLFLKANEPGKPDKGQRDNSQRWDWRKLLRTMKDVGSVMSFIVSLIKILQELGIW